MGSYPFGLSGPSFGWQFYAGLPSGGDDTPAIQAAIGNAAAYAAANAGYAEILLAPALYRVNGALIQNAATKTSSQLTLPLVGPGAQAVTLAFRSTGAGRAQQPYYNQTVAQLAGPALLSGLTGQAYSGTWGNPAVLGGPTAEQGYGTATGIFNNVHPVIDGITVIAQGPNPTVGGFNFAGCAQATVSAGAYLTTATIAQMAATQPANNWVNGLTMPQDLNTDNQLIGSWTAYGAFRGLLHGAHVSAQRIGAFYCNRGISIQASGMDNHGGHIGYATVENCNSAYYSEATAVPTHPLAISIGNLDTQNLSQYAAGWHVFDPDFSLGGHIEISDLNPTALLISGAGYAEIINANFPRGNIATPALVLGTALLNPFWRHWVLNGAGGTLTGVQVDGVAVGATSGAPWSVTVPSGHTVTLVGTVLPTTLTSTLL